MLTVFHFLHLLKRNDEVRNLLQSRYARVKRIPGIRICHRFKRISSSILEIMRTSDGDDCSIKCNLEIGAKELQLDLIGKFFAYIIDSNWSIGVVKEVSEGDTDYRSIVDAI